MQIVLFEDDRVDQLAPLTMGRPAYAIGCASYRLIDLVELLGPVRCIVREYLRALETANGRSLLCDGETLAGPTLAVNARLVPTVAIFAELRKLIEVDRPAVAFSLAKVSQPLF